MMRRDDHIPSIPSPAAPGQDIGLLVPKPTVAKELGISTRTLSRWMKRESVGLPASVPVLYGVDTLGRPLFRIFWRRDQLEAFKAKLLQGAIESLADRHNAA